MEAFFIHTLKWAVCVALFYSCWALLLRHETFHLLNRLLLVAFLLVGAVLPLIDFTAPADVPLAGSLGAIGEKTFYAVVSSTSAPIRQFGSSFSTMWPMLIVGVYIIGIVITIGKYALDLWAVVRLIRRSRLAEVRDGMRICLSDEMESPVSWMRWVVISPSDLAAHGHTFLAHEAAHIRSHHSHELLVAETCVRLQWFNPFAWMLLHDLRTVQEYEADHAALRHTDCESYAHLLVTKAVGMPLPAANTFLRSPLKARIKMMMRPASRWIRSGRALFALPIAGFALLLLANPEVVQAVAKARTIKELPAAISTGKPKMPTAEPPTTELPAAEQPDTLAATSDATAIDAVPMQAKEPLPPLTQEYILRLINIHTSQTKTYVMISSDDGSPLHSEKFDYYIDERKSTPEEFMQYTDLLDLGDPRICVFAAKPTEPVTALSITPAAFARKRGINTTAGEAVVQVFTSEEALRAFRDTPNAPSSNDSLATQALAKTSSLPKFGMLKAIRIDRDSSEHQTP